MHLLPRVRVTLHVRAPETELAWDLGWVGRGWTTGDGAAAPTVNRPSLLFIKRLDVELRVARKFPC